MRPFVFTSLFLSLFLFSAFSGTKTITESSLIGVFDRDSLLHEMPGYQKIIDSMYQFHLQYDSVELEMFDQLAAKRADFFRDSSKFSPVIKQLKCIEIQDLRMRIGEFSEYAQQELRYRTSEALKPLNDKITTAAEKVKINGKHPSRVMDKTELLYSDDIYDADKKVNVTTDIRILMGLR